MDGKYALKLQVYFEWAQSLGRAPIHVLHVALLIRNPGRGVHQTLKCLLNKEGNASWCKDHKICAYTYTLTLDVISCFSNSPAVLIRDVLITPLTSQFPCFSANITPFRALLPGLVVDACEVLSTVPDKT